MESLPGSMSLFSEAYAEMTGSGLTGQEALAAFYEAVPRGDVVSAEILPIVSRLMSERAQPKLGVLKQSSIAQQARTINELNNLLERFSKSGGERGFANFFRTMSEQLPRLTPLVEGLAGAFDSLMRKIEPVLTTFGDYVYLLTQFKGRLDEIDPMLVKLAGTFLILSTRIGRMMAPFTLLYLLLEDLAIGAIGGDAVSTYLFDFLDKFLEYDRGIMAITAAFVSLAGALIAIKGIGKLALPGVPKGAGGGFKLGKLAATTLTVGALSIAGAIGWEVGSQINDKLVEGTGLGNSIGKNMTRIASILGVEGAEEALIANGDSLAYNSRVSRYKSLGLSQPMWEYYEKNIGSSYDSIYGFLDQYRIKLPSETEDGKLDPGLFPNSNVEDAANRAQGQNGASVNPTINIEINADGVLDPVGLNSVSEGLTERIASSLSDMLITTNNSYGVA